MKLFCFASFLHAQNVDSINHTKLSSLPAISFGPTQQDVFHDSLRKLLNIAESDSTKFRLLGALSFSYAWSKPDTGLFYAQQQMLIAKKSRSVEMEMGALFSMGVATSTLGNYIQALSYFLQDLKMAEEYDYKPELFKSNLGLCYTYRDQGDYEHAIYYGHSSKKVAEQQLDSANLLFALMHIGSVYEKFNILDSALVYTQKAVEIEKAMYGKIKWSALAYVLGNIYTKKENYKLGFQYYREGISLSINRNVIKDLVDIYNGMAKAFMKTGQIDSTIFYANKTITVGQTAQYPLGILVADSLLSEVYKIKQNDDSVLKYVMLTTAVKDSLFNRDKLNQVQNISFNEQVRQQEIETAKVEYLNQIRMYALVAGSGIFLLITAILYRNNKQKQRANILLQQQKEKVESTLLELKSMQAHLIQSEKMASLGELTAGIAHEIQNPLNFVNNFSEVNAELIDELEGELKSGNSDEAISIAGNIRDNQLKINHHGKRADAIVKGMLQHSRTSSGVKEPTDINELADEYLRLSYHGFRAKDKEFNSTINTDFDKSIGDIQAVRQDIGRVLLNLYNNAFYAVSEKQKHCKKNYTPTVTVSTKRTSKQIEIRVSDNGNGIPEHIVDKIFQPFFTTKPTGQGTGLGLSLSYDIIKAHGGEIKVESKEDVGSEFIVSLPYAT